VPTSDGGTWWARARDRARGGPSDALDILAWNDLPHEDQERIQGRVKVALAHEDPTVRALGWRIAEDVEVAEWGDGGPLPEHLALEISAAHKRGQPLDPGEPVPGCSCPTCTGIPAEDPARIQPRTWAPSETWERRVEEARNRPLLDVARDLGMEPKKAGREHVERCPFHEDKTPSLNINPGKGVWHCFSCLEGGDGIALVRAVRRLGFKEAVEWLVP
jgi:hypothetical protein